MQAMEGEEARQKSLDNYFLLATENNNKAEVRRAILAGAVIDKKDRYGKTALARTARDGYLEVVKLLLASGAGINEQVNAGYTPLMLAAKHGHSAVVGLLLANRAAVDKQDTFGYTPLRVAAKWEYLTDDLEKKQEYKKIIKLLIEHEANPWAIAKNGTTILDENSETIREYVLERIPGILKEVVASQLSLELPDDIARLLAKFAYSSLPECESAQ